MRAASYFLRVWLREKELVLVVEIDDFVGKRGRHLRSGGQIFGGGKCISASRFPEHSWKGPGKIYMRRIRNRVIQFDRGSW
jgi:hypothetical protein